MPINQFGANATLETVIRERRKDVAAITALEQGKRPGRIRTGLRSAPSSATDVAAGDAEGDIVVDATYVFSLLKVGGTLKWDRRAHSVGW